MNIIQRLLALLADQRGSATLEYGLICALVLLVTIFSFASPDSGLSVPLKSVVQLR